jgi:RecJ-like exonuclease
MLERCEICNGGGILKEYNICWNCLGAGKLTWIDNMLGKQDNKENEIDLLSLTIFIHKCGENL